MIDFTIRRAASVGVFAPLAAVGMRWASQPQANAVVVVEQPPEFAVILQWAVPAGILIGALALMVLVRRYHWIRKTLGQGTRVEGTVRDVDIYEREAERTSTTPAFGAPKIRTYYADIACPWQGVEHRVRLRLPFSPSTYQIAVDRVVDLLVLDSTPKRPLIRKVYLGDVKPRKGSWWFF